MSDTATMTGEQPSIAKVLGVEWERPIDDETGWERERVDPSMAPSPPSAAMFHGPLGDAVRALAPTQSVDPISVFAQSFTMLGGLIGPDVYFREGVTKRSAASYCLIVGGTGSGKGRAGGIAKYIGRRVAEPENFDDRCIDGVASGEALIEAMADTVEGTADGADQPVPEGRDGRLILFVEEFGGLASAIESRGGSYEKVIVRAFDAETLSNRTKGMVLKASKPHLAIVSHVTAEELRRGQILTQTQVYSGFLNRWNLIVTKAPGRTLDDVWVEDVPGFREAVDRCAVAIHQRRRDGEHVYTRTSAADDVWLDTTDKLWDSQATHSELIDVQLTRARAHILKAAVGYAVLDGADQIDDVHLLAARSLWAYGARSVKTFFGTWTGDPTIDAFLKRWRDDFSFGDISRTDVAGLMSNGLTKARIDGMLDKLADQGVLTVAPDKNARKSDKGRIPVVVRLSAPADAVSSPSTTSENW